MEHDAYCWLCGAVSVFYHTLSDFRADHGAVLGELLTDRVAVLIGAQAVTLNRVGQDGIRVRARAGAASFRRRGILEQHLADARAHVAALKPQLDADPAPLSRRQHAARMRAARQREDRVNQALTRMPESERSKAKQGKLAETARGSTTEAEATVKKRGDGGFQPAYNTQFTTDTESQVVVGIAVTTVGSDLAQLAPMVEHVAARYGETSDKWLVDGGYLAHEQLEAVAE